MVNIWRTEFIKIQTNFSLNQTNCLLIQTHYLILQPGMQTNLSRHPNRHSIPCTPFLNRCRTRPGIRNPGQPAPIFSNYGYNSLLSCCRLYDQWRLARASSQDRLPQRCVIQAAALGPGTLPEPHIIRIVAIRAPASGARTRLSSSVPKSMDKADWWTRVCFANMK